MGGESEGRPARTETRLNSIDNLLKEIKEQLANIVKKVNHIEEKVTFQGRRIVEMEESLKECINMRVELDTLKAENLQLKSRLKKLEVREVGQQILGKRNMMEINGIPKHNNENVAEIIVELAKAAEVIIEAKDIAECYRAKGRDGKDGIITVKFEKSVMRDNVLNTLKKMKPTLKVLKMEPASRKVFINEALIPARKNILYRVKQMARERNWKRVWTYGGAIFLKTEIEGPQIKIETVEDLEILIKE